MALQGAIPVEFGVMFPDGVYAAGVFEPVRDFDRSQGERFVQQLDKGSGLPLWTVDVIDADQSARQRTVKVKVAAEHLPALPPAPAGAPFTPVEFTAMTVTPYVNQSGRLAYSFKATGIRAPGPEQWTARPRGQGDGGVNGARLDTFGGAWLHAGADVRAQCQVFEDGHLPFLSVEGAAVGFSVFLPGPVISADHLRFARELAEQARRFAEECERLHAAQAPAAGPA